MADAPAVLLLDDGELDDVQQMLEGLRIPYGRVRGGAIVKGTPPPRDVLISTPRRIEAVKTVQHEGGGTHLRVVVVNEDSNALREQLRRVGFDYLVRRPVHPEALRLLLLHCLYKGEERRSEPRVAVGVEVSFRAGLINRRATLADLSIRGCRLISDTRIEEQRRIKVSIPEALDTGDPFTVTGRVLRCSKAEGDRWTTAVQFDGIGDEAHDALELIIEDRARGPATLRPGVERPLGSNGGPDAGPGEVESTIRPVTLRQPVIESPPPQAPPLQVDVSLAPELEPAEGEESKDEPPEAVPAERRHNRRGSYAQTVPAFGDRALRVLVGRDLSVGGMRIEPMPGLEVGDRLHLAIYGDPGSAPFLVWASVRRDDGDGGVALVFDPLEAAVGQHLEGLVGSLPAVESLHDSEIEAMGTVMTEIVE